MKNREIAVGLDIGTTKIVAMVGRKNEHGKIEILGVGVSESPGVHRGVVTNIVKTVNSIKEAVEKAEAMSGHKINEVTVGIAGQQIRSLQINSSHVAISYAVFCWKKKKVHEDLADDI